MQQKVFEALTEGKDALQRINSSMSVEDVEQLMEDTQEALEYQRVSLLALIPLITLITPRMLWRIRD